MEELKDRIYILRKTLGLSMEKFGNRLAISKSSISGFEKGTTNPSEQTLKLICSEFNVNYPWLTEGKGEMLTGFPESKIDELKMEFNLSDAAASIIRNFVNMPEEKQNAIVELFEAVAKDMKKDDS